jgi:hypothetical protein
MPSKERLAFVATQKAPMVHVTGIVLSDENNGWTTLTLDCGHSAKSASHFSHKINELYRCHACGKQIALSLPEFQG